MKQRNLSLDLLKIVLALMVVALHANVFIEEQALLNYLSVQGIFRIAVPIFLFINGFYFYSIVAKQDIQKWLLRIVYLYLFWMLFYCYFWFKPLSHPFETLIKVVFGFQHLWYLVGMLGGGLLTYMLSQRYKTGALLACFALSIGVVIQYIGNYNLATSETLNNLFNEDYIHRNFLFLGFPFFYMGYLCRVYQEPLQKIYTSRYQGLLIVIGLSILLLESLANFYIAGNERDGFDNYLALLITTPLIGLATIQSKLTTTNAQLGLLSSGIYFIHPFWLIFLKKINLNDQALLFIFASICSVISAYGLIHINKRLKFIL